MENCELFLVNYIFAVQYSEIGGLYEEFKKSITFEQIKLILSKLFKDIRFESQKIAS